MYDKYSDGNRKEINRLCQYQFKDFEEMLDSLKEELRGYDVNIKTISDIENNNIYPLEIFDNNIYNS